jgi:hypothetical protein
MNIERIQEPISSARFHNYHKELVDLDFLFKDANKFFARYFLDLGTTPTFEFKENHNKKLYTNEFIRVVCDWVKSRDCNYTLYFYWNIREDPFRNKLVKKLKNTFGFRIWEGPETLDEFIQKIQDKDCSTMTGLEVFFGQEKSTKTFKQIKKHLEKTGMSYLNNQYFEELNNKMILFC